ncbi:MAG TPA: substrate-binding domain-containing protein [Xanthobacteraceae bacterium]|jgi:molybdate transport system substrate-binding protein|nr:substrate-binding domain-containing protein [Xanthobacteraceae bacterium]
MKIKSLMVAVVALAAASPVHAVEVTAFVSNALKSTVSEHSVTLDKGSGVILKATYGTTEPLRLRIEKGEMVDFALLGEEAIDDLLKKGRLVAGSRVAVARAGLGVAIRQGAPKLDLSSTEAFKRAMLAAKSISYNERGLTGDYLKVLFARLGITEAVKAKHKNGRGAALVSTGESEIGITQVSEILIEPGLDVAGLFPAEIQNYSIFAAAIGTDSDEPQIAHQIIRHFVRSEWVKVMVSKGLEPLR